MCCRSRPWPSSLRLRRPSSSSRGASTSLWASSWASPRSARPSSCRCSWPGTCPSDSTIALASLIVLAASVLPGLVSGIVITKFKVPPFIATLGMWGITNGLALKICQGYPMAGLPDVLPTIGNSYILYVHPGDFVSFFSKPDWFPYNRIRELARLVPSSLPFVLVVLAILSFILIRGRFGRHTYAIGGSMDAAHARVSPSMPISSRSTSYPLSLRAWPAFSTSSRPASVTTPLSTPSTNSSRSPR